MATERRSRRPTTLPKPAGPETAEEKNRALIGIEEWYKEVTRQEDIREILTELTK